MGEWLREKITEVPVCNSFKPKVFMDQLCYEVDPNKYMNSLSARKKLNLILLIDFNEDRQISSENSKKTDWESNVEENDLLIMEKAEKKGEMIIGAIGSINLESYNSFNLYHLL